MSCKYSCSGVYASVLGAAAFAVTASAFAQSYPTRPVQVIVPYTAGGSIDIMTRAVAQGLNKLWGQNVVIDNRPGASGMIGTELVTRAKPDGYTLLGNTSSFPATVSVRAKLPFDPVKQIVPIATFSRAPMLIAVHNSIPATSVKELVELAKKRNLTYGSSGAGGNNHFSGALFAAATGVEMTHVPFKGIANAVTALSGGEIDVLISSAAALGPAISAKRVRLLAVTSPKPSPLFPGIPAAAEVGAPGYEYELWWGLFGPAGMPQELVEQINAAVNKVITGPEFQKFLEQEKAQVWAQSPKELEGFLAREIERYRKISQIAGIKPM